VDYADDAALRAALIESKRRLGDWSLGVLWIHSSAPRTMGIVIEAMEEIEGRLRVFEIIGSAGSQPGAGKPGIMDHRHARIAWRRVVLGFVPSRGGTRWLSHPAICGGVEAAIMADLEHSIVGTVEPWESRSR
jgi:hypothetical protein